MEAHLALQDWRTRKEPTMVARIAIYTYSGDRQELARRAEAGILPILKAQPGFRSYAVAISDEKVFSSSAWDSRAEAETGSAAVAEWVADNMTEISLVGDVEYGEIAFNTALGVSAA
jgi:heme-degrading monooxygenase HmoA